MTRHMEIKCEICGSTEDVRRYRCHLETELHRLCSTCRRLFRLLTVMRFDDVKSNSLGDSPKDRLVGFSKLRLQSISKCLMMMDVDRKELVEALPEQPCASLNSFQFPMNVERGLTTH